jgi:dTDP-4-amino-4,6-dideoxygalactose transaminase
MHNDRVSRRSFLKSSGLATAGAALATQASATSAQGANETVPALLGGPRARKTGWQNWPPWDAEKFNPRLIEVMNRRNWVRGARVNEFEKKWADMHGVKHCLVTVNGTNALSASWMQLDIHPGDEVICSPYTFGASVFGVLYKGAMPVWADIDPMTFQIDPEKIKEKITPRTKGILPVHICGYPSDMPTIMKIAKEHNLFVVEDACQAHLAELDGKKMGTFGNAGCFSFQESKPLPIGEGGAILTDDTDLYNRLYSYHNYGFLQGVQPGAIDWFRAYILGNKIRMAELQAAIGLCQMEKLEERHKIRNERAAYLSEKLSKYPGVTPVRLYKGAGTHATQASYYIYSLVYNQDGLDGLPRSKFIAALSAEGVPGVGPGYPNDPMYTQPFLHEVFKSDIYKKFYTADELDFEKYKQRNHCPGLLKTFDTCIWIWHTGFLLGSESDMDDIVNAVDKIHNNAAKIKAA